jgi:hypothetical protein
MDAPASAPAPEPPGLLLRALIAYQQCYQFTRYWLRQTLCCGACPKKCCLSPLPFSHTARIQPPDSARFSMSRRVFFNES